MRRSLFGSILTLAALVVPGHLLAGGFWLQLGNPEASPAAQKMHAAVTVKAAGCHDPAKAKITASAVAMVDGRREAIPLKLEPLPEAGAWALTGQWPREGHWVIHFRAETDGLVTSALADTGPKGIDREHAKFKAGAFTDTEIDAMLRNPGELARK